MKSGMAVLVGALLLVSVCAAGGVFSPGIDEQISGSMQTSEIRTESEDSPGHAVEDTDYQPPAEHATVRERQRMLRDRDGGGLSLTPQMIRAHVHTKCAGVEKNISLFNALLQPINVDDNDDTGENGNDFRVRFFPFPDVGEQDVGWVLALSAVLEVERLGTGLEQEEFEIELYLHLSLGVFGYGEHTIRLGYSSLEGDTIPEKEQIIFTVAPYVFYDHPPVFAVTHVPSFTGSPSDVTLIASYDGSFGSSEHHHQASITYAPAVEATTTFTPRLEAQQLDLSLERSASQDTVITMGYEGELNGEGTALTLAIDALPAEMAFSLGYALSGNTGTIDYESSSEFNVTLTLSMDRMDVMGSLQVQYLPTSFHASWTPKLYGGHVNVSTNACKTKIILTDDVDDPSLYFSVTNMSTSTSLTWGIGQEGYLELHTAETGPHVQFWWEKSPISLEMNAWLRTASLSLEWVIENEGHVTVDTGDNWLSTYSLNFTMNDNVGLRLAASLLKADTFTASWVVWPPSFSLSGSIELVGDIAFAVMLGGDWYEIVPA
ncbi:MAG: hypothetical protein KGY55_01955 [Candidatus Thermoplasmatota archaeon]|nr:hypothetical protein [Candidatus Thermoplasmatota archaeon]